MHRRKPMTVDQARRAIDNLTTDQRTVRADQLLLEELARACYGPRWRRGVARILPAAPSSPTVD